MTYFADGIEVDIDGQTTSGVDAYNANKVLPAETGRLFLPLREGQVQTEHPAKVEGERHQAQDR